MRAVVVVNGRADGGFLMGDRYPVPMLWFVDKPLIQRVCESLVEAGVRTVDWVHYHATKSPEYFLGDGERWGVSFRHHSADDAESPYDLVRDLLATGADPNGVLFGHADRVVQFPSPMITDSDEDAVRVFEPADGQGWAGWAVLSGRAIALFPGKAVNRHDVERHLYKSWTGPMYRERIPAGPAVRCVESFLAASRSVLADSRSDGPVSVPRSARIHPSAQLIGPVRIGPWVEIGTGAVLGPGVVIGPNCILGRKTVLTNTVVMPDSLIGGQLILDSAVVDRDRIVSAGFGGLAHIDHEVPVASLKGHPFSRVSSAGFTSRAKAMVRLLGGVPARLSRRMTAHREFPAESAPASMVPIAPN